MVGFILVFSFFFDDYYLVDIYINYNFSLNWKKVYKNVEDYEKLIIYKK